MYSADIETKARILVEAMDDYINDDLSANDKIQALYSEIVRLDKLYIADEIAAYMDEIAEMAASE